MRMMIKGAARLPWLLDKAVYTGKSFSVAAQISNFPTGMFFRSNGLGLYISDGQDVNTGKIHQYSLSTAWDISTAIFVGSYTLTYAIITNPNDLFFSSDGTKLYAARDGATIIYQHSLSTAWDISTTSYDSVSLSGSNLYGVFFKPNGTKLYYSSTDSNGIVHQYSLSSAWDLSTATYDSISLSTTSQDTTPVGLRFSDNGLILSIAGQANKKIYQYSLSTAWDISTATYRGSYFNVSGQETTVQGLEFGSNGSLMYIIGNTEKIYQYSL